MFESYTIGKTLRDEHKEIDGIGFKKTIISKNDGTQINPATEEKQDDAIEQISPYTNFEGGGKVSIGTTPVKMTFTIIPKLLRFEADRSNNDIIYYGGSDIDSSGNNAMGTLEANNVEIIPYDDTTKPIYFVAASGTQNVWKGAYL